MQDLTERLGMPMIFRPWVGSGSAGTRLVKLESEASEQLEPGCVAERIVSGREMSIESFIVDRELLSTRISNHFEPGWADIVPGELAAEQRSRVETVSWKRQSAPCARRRGRCAFGCARNSADAGKIRYVSEPSDLWSPRCLKNKR